MIEHSISAAKCRCGYIKWIKMTNNLISLESDFAPKFKKKLLVSRAVWVSEL